DLIDRAAALGYGALAITLHERQQHVPALNRSFDTPDQNDAALGRVRRQPAQVELPLVEGDGEGTVSERCRPIDEIDTGMRDSIDWIVSGMRVELDFQHR